MSGFKSRLCYYQTYVILSKWLSLSGPEFHHCKSGNNKRVYYVMESLKCLRVYVQKGFICATASCSVRKGHCHLQSVGQYGHSGRYAVSQVTWGSTLAVGLLLEIRLFIFQSCRVLILWQLKEMCRERSLGKGCWRSICLSTKFLKKFALSTLKIELESLGHSYFPHI